MLLTASSLLVRTVLPLLVLGLVVRLVALVMGLLWRRRMVRRLTSSTLLLVVPLPLVLLLSVPSLSVLLLVSGLVLLVTLLVVALALSRRFAGLLADLPAAGLLVAVVAPGGVLLMLV